MSSRVEVLNPVSQTIGSIRNVRPAPRPTTLDGKRIGLLWNLKRGGDVALQTIGTALEQHFKGAKAVMLQGARKNTEGIFKKIQQQCDVVIGATGD